MRLISAWKNFIFGTWISAAGVSAPPVACSWAAEAPALKPASIAPDWMNPLLVFHMSVRSFSG